MFKLTLKNLTNDHKQITIGNSSFTVDPQQTRQVYLNSVPNVLESSNLDSTGKARIRLPTGSDTVYISNDGLKFSNQMKSIYIENDSCFPIYFVKIASDGKRWPICMLPPKEKRKIETSINTQWEVVTPERPDIILSTFFLQNEPYMIFDGEKIR